jgi:membrane protein
MSEQPTGLRTKIMKTKREFSKWELVLGIAELAAMIFLAWSNVSRTSRMTRDGDICAIRISPPSAEGNTATPVPDTPEGTDEPVPAQGREFRLKTLGQIALAAAWSWSSHRAASKGAALALYTLFSLAPMLVLVVAVAGLFIGADAVRQLLLDQMSGLLGTQGAEALKTILAGAHYGGDSLTAALISTALVLAGATSAFSELKNSLDELWEVPATANTGLWGLIRGRFLSFGLVLVMILMLLISLAISAALSALGAVWVGGMTEASFVLFAKTVASIASFLIVTALFAIIYKYLPDVPIAWRDVILGAIITAVLFVAGKWVIGLYLSQANFSSGYGAAGSLVLLVSWIFYSAQIFFYSALFTHEHAIRSGRVAHASRHMDAAGCFASPSDIS